ncbi:MAG: hypothetical protein AABX13_04460 [Nanoarchaeota archaeon]
MIEAINPYSMKIIIACRQQDSIRAIAQRIQVSYGWTYQWMQELARKGVVRLTRMKVYLNEQNRFYQKTIHYIRQTLGSYVSFYYEVLSLLGIRYCFIQTDAVYIWTKGGYNIARYREYYPIFIKVQREDKKLFEWYCKKIGLAINRAKGIFYKVQYVDSLRPEYYQGMPVESLDETIRFMNQYPYNFLPALEMIKGLHQQIKPTTEPITVEYQEAVTNV